MSGPTTLPPRPVGASAYPSCRWCKHDWHGLLCYTCLCASATGAQDDSWRPELSASHQDMASRVMHDTGCDGWVALACTKLHQAIGRVSPSALRTKLYGTFRRR